MYDVCIIGAGVVGMNIARELSKYQLKICVLEKREDVSCGCSKANSGIVHGGYSDKPGSLKAEVCVAGNRMYEKLDQELHFGYRQTGSLVLAFQPEELDTLKELYDNGLQNGVGGLKLIDAVRVRELEPHLSSEVQGALYCANAGVVSPYEFVIALAENAVANGVELFLQTEVTAIEPVVEGYRLTARGRDFTAAHVINCAGVYCDAIAAMVGVSDYKVTPRRGQYVVLDKEQNYLVNSIIFQVPTKMGKGILVTTTYHGNLMIGPDAQDIDDKEDVSTDEAALEAIVRAARKSVPGFDMKKALTSFAGNRPVADCKDFVIEERPRNFLQLIGIDSPGLTSSPAIALKVVEKLKAAGLVLAVKPDFIARRAPIIHKKDDSFAGGINDSNPETHLICRCEQVTEAEIIDCLRRGLPVNSLDGVKRRTRAGMGRCQGAFCGPRVRELLARELNIPADAVGGRGPASSQLAQRLQRGQLTRL
ncbi:MAG TPA: NAD(P)/FAD-dependent oxidoreductase [Patescibacteria group bacterium]|nr:NAD(P)/FAD-dependent oxidoreductase [Patescibacteria group bacterium]